MAKNIGQLFVSLSMDSSKLKRGLSEAERAMKNVGSKISQIGKTTNSTLTPALKNAGNTASKTSTAISSLKKSILGLSLIHI